MKVLCKKHECRYNTDLKCGISSQIMLDSFGMCMDFVKEDKE